MKSGERLIGKTVLTLTSALCCLGLCACKSTTVIKTAEQPGLQTGSPLKGIKPLRVCLNDFQDVRGSQPDVIFAVMEKTYKLDQPVASWVRESIRREFERNGHSCVGPDKAGEADVVLDGSVYRYSLDLSTGIEYMRFTGNVGAKISARSAKDSNAVFAKKYDGSFYAGGWNIRIPTVIKVQNEALLAMIKELTSDQEFLDFLKRQQPP